MNEDRRCRTCLSDQNLHPIFLLPEHSEKYATTLYISAGIKVELNDTFPKHLCSSCITFINKSMAFRKSCLFSQKLLLDNTDLNGINFNIKKKMSRTSSSSVDIKHMFSDLNQYHADILKLLKKNHECHEFQDNQINVLDPSVKIENQSDDEMDMNEENNVSVVKVNDDDIVGNQPSEMVEVQISPTDIMPEVKDDGVYTIKKNSTYKKLLAKIKKAGISKRGKKHRCLYCPYSTTNREALNIHVRHHTGEKPYECDHCGNSFAGRNNLIQHLAIHLPEKKFKCKFCPKYFQSAKFARDHSYNVHSGRRYRYMCPVCGHLLERPHKVILHAKKTHGLNKAQLGTIERVLDTN